MSSTQQNNNVDKKDTHWSPSGLYKVILDSGNEEELQKNYDLWASEYDGDNSSMGYAVPLEAAKLCVKYSPKSDDVCLLDVGAGMLPSGCIL